MYVPESANRTMAVDPPKPELEGKPRRGGQVIDVPRAPIPFSLAKLPHVSDKLS
jgi:hypothetical protein